MVNSKFLRLFVGFATLFILGGFKYLPDENIKLEYDIIKGKNKIGELNATQKRIGDEMIYAIDSKVVISFLFELNIQFKYDSKFEKDYLTWSDFSNMTNDKERESTEITWEKHRYKVKTDKKESYLSKSQIAYTLSKMYFKEPVGKTMVFSERFAEYLTISEIEAHVYELTLPDGKKNIYTFENGICKEVKVDHTLATFYFRLKK
ncbi:DUF6134 family protein [Flexithrix dorotheae]|uniref:DUF6134 family protein n=1 Tax=Flexithrix dorotheae TaxID=70993 RepID=UPI00039AF8D6|nr:DUF6134 family protein [Flexithrix dorotheae]